MKATKKAVVEPCAETKPSADAVKRQTGNQHCDDLVVGNAGGFSSRLCVPKLVSFSWPPCIVNRQNAACLWSASQRQASQRLVVEERTDIRLTRHGIKDHDPSVEIRFVEETSQTNTYTSVINAQRGAISFGTPPKRRLRIDLVNGLDGLGHATEGSEEPRSATAGEGLTTTSDKRLGESTLTAARARGIG